MRYLYYSIWLSIAIGLMCIISVARAAEWNEKPVMCADHNETFIEIVEKGQQLVWTSVQFTKVKGPPLLQLEDMYILIGEKFDILFMISIFLHLESCSCS